jgi:hypothetical protein
MESFGKLAERTLMDVVGDERSARSKFVRMKGVRKWQNGFVLTRAARIHLSE